MERLQIDYPTGLSICEDNFAMSLAPEPDVWEAFVGLIWRVTIVNNSDVPISIQHYSITPVARFTATEDLYEGVLDLNFKPLDMPLNLDAHRGVSVLLKVTVPLEENATAVARAKYRTCQVVALPSLRSFFHDLYEKGVDPFDNDIEEVAGRWYFKGWIFRTHEPNDKTYYLRLTTSKQTLVTQSFSWYKYRPPEPWGQPPGTLSAP